MEEQIIATTKSIGWQYILEMFNAEIDFSKKTITAEDDRGIAVQYLGRIEAERIIKGVLQKIGNMEKKDVKPITYK